MGYNVYKAPDGCAESFIGHVETLDEALMMIATEPEGLEESLYATARAAGHVNGMEAPDKRAEIEDEENGRPSMAWLTGDYVAVETA